MGELPPDIQKFFEEAGQGPCPSTIHSPWRFGASVTCGKRDGHDAEHSFSSAAGDFVAWNGQNEKLTAIQLSR